MIIFDWDKTLFNTNLLKDDFVLIFEKYDISGQEFWKSFYLAYDADSEAIGTYSIDKHIALLKDLSDKKQTKLKDELELLIQHHGPDYLFSDVIPTLENLKSNGEHMVLINKGNEQFQDLKIDATGIRHYFDEVHTVPGDKIQALKKYAAINNVVNINDNLKELKVAQQEFPNIANVLISRHHAVDIGIPSILSVKSLSELAWYLRTLQIKSV